MQIWYPGPEVRDDGDYAVTRNPGKSHPFVIITLSDDGRTALIVQSAEEADRLIKAAVKAKRLLDPPAPERPAEPEAAPADDAETCGFRYLDTDGVSRLCQRRPGGEHHESHWQYDDDDNVVHDSAFPAIPADESGPAFGEAELRRADAYGTDRDIPAACDPDSAPAVTA